MGCVTAIYIHRNNGDVLKTLIDTDDLERAKQFPNTWCVSWSCDTQSYYCYGKLTLQNGKRESILLHRWLMNSPKTVQVDHFDNDTLNNRRKENLRFVKHAENHQNRSGAQNNSKSGVRGVSWHKHKNKWQAIVNRKCVGYFSTIQDAEKAVKEARKALMPFSKEATSL